MSYLKSIRLMELKVCIKDSEYRLLELWFTEDFILVHLIPVNKLSSPFQLLTIFLLNSLLLKLLLLCLVSFHILLTQSEEDLWCNLEELELMERRCYCIMERWIVLDKSPLKRGLQPFSRELFQIHSEELELLWSWCFMTKSKDFSHQIFLKEKEND